MTEKEQRSLREKAAKCISDTHGMSYTEALFTVRFSPIWNAAISQPGTVTDSNVDVWAETVWCEYTGAEGEDDEDEDEWEEDEDHDGFSVAPPKFDGQFLISLYDMLQEEFNMTPEDAEFAIKGTSKSISPAMDMGCLAETLYKEYQAKDKASPLNDDEQVAFRRQVAEKIMEDHELCYEEAIEAVDESQLTCALDDNDEMFRGLHEEWAEKVWGEVGEGYVDSGLCAPPMFEDQCLFALHQHLCSSFGMSRQDAEFAIKGTSKGISPAMDMGRLAETLYKEYQAKDKASPLNDDEKDAFINQVAEALAERHGIAYREAIDAIDESSLQEEMDSNSGVFRGHHEEWADAVWDEVGGSYSYGGDPYANCLDECKAIDESRDWEIHYVTNMPPIRARDLRKECLGRFGGQVKSFSMKGGRKFLNSNICNVHTHGLDKYGQEDFQVVLDLWQADPSGREAVAILNRLGDRVRNGERFRAGEFASGIVANDNVRFDEFEDDGRKVLRVILPDEEGNFPDTQDEDRRSNPWSVLQKIMSGAVSPSSVFGGVGVISLGGTPYGSSYQDVGMDAAYRLQCFPLEELMESCAGSNVAPDDGDGLKYKGAEFNYDEAFDL